MNSFAFSSKSIACVALVSSLLLMGCGGSSTSSDEGGPELPPQNAMPAADAGTDQNVGDNDVVTLDGTGSSDPDGDELYYAWEQTAGPDVVIADSTSAQATFTAPAVAGGTSLSFALSVSDSDGAQDSSTVTVSVADTTSPVMAMNDDVGIHQSIVIVFNETVNPASLHLSGMLEGLEASAVWSATNAVNDTATITPSSAWEVGSHTVVAEVLDLAGNPGELDVEVNARLVFNNFQSAALVIGQPDFTTSEWDEVGDSPQANEFRTPMDLAYDDMADVLYVADKDYGRVLGFDGVPTENHASATTVVGQPDMISTTVGYFATTTPSPFSVAVSENRLFVLNSNRISIYDPVPTTAPGSASTVIGQADKTTNAAACTSDRFVRASRVVVTSSGKVIVADAGGNRVLIWNNVPDIDGVPADIVLGQEDFTNCEQNGGGEPDASSLNAPVDVWSDGNRLAVVDRDNYRVLIWNNFPETNGESADVVLGQSDFSHNAYMDIDQDGNFDGYPSASTFSLPIGGIWVNGNQLFVGDGWRVLIWNQFPTESFAPADVVLGQADMQSDMSGDPDTGEASARVMYVNGIITVGNQLLVTDGYYNRVLIFESQ